MSDFKFQWLLNEKILELFKRTIITIIYLEYPIFYEVFFIFQGLLRTFENIGNIGHLIVKGLHHIKEIVNLGLTIYVLKLFMYTQRP